MSGASVIAELARHLGLPAEALDDAQPRRVDLSVGLPLEWRWVAPLPALCLAIPLGQVLGHRQDETLINALAANLYLADGGHPHYALSPQDDTLYLCRTLCGEGLDAAQAIAAIEQLTEAALQARQALRQQLMLE